MELVSVMQDPVRGAAPVFVIGAPRSGTSVLTWCLGQHPNLLPLEESGWLGRFSLDVGAAFRRGSTRGERSPLCMLGVGRDECFAAIGAAIDRMISEHRGALEERSRRVGELDPAQAHAGIATSRAQHEPKARWVDGTPEHSFHAAGLHALFPQARFIHLVRDADEVVDSMLAFRHEDGSPLVAGRAAAWDYWLRAVNACVLAELALGPALVQRVRYADLQQPETTLRRILAFLGEDYAPACIEPLAVRVNACAGAAALLPGDAADEALVERARRLSARLQREPQAPQSSPAACREFEAAFAAQIGCAESVDDDYARAQAALALRDRQLEERTAWSQRLDAELGALRRRYVAGSGEAQRRIALQDGDIVLARRLLAGAAALALLAATLLVGTDILPEHGALVASLTVACACSIGYAWLRRRGARAAFTALLERGARARPVP
jgi:hypothetical protein